MKRSQFTEDQIIGILREQELVAYSEEPDGLGKFVIEKGWFHDDEVIRLSS